MHSYKTIDCCGQRLAAEHIEMSTFIPGGNIKIQTWYFMTVSAACLLKSDFIIAGKNRKSSSDMNPIYPQVLLCIPGQNRTSQNLFEDPPIPFENMTTNSYSTP